MNSGRDFCLTAAFSFLNGDFASAAVLISFGAVLGVLSPIQLLVMALVEVVFYTLNEFIIIDLLKVTVF